MHFAPARFFRCTVRWPRASDVTVQEGISRDGAAFDLCMFHSALQDSDESKLGNCPSAFHAVWWPGSYHCPKMKWWKRVAHLSRSGISILSRQVEPKEATCCFFRVCKASAEMRRKHCGKPFFFFKVKILSDQIYPKLLNQVSQIKNKKSKYHQYNQFSQHKPASEL